MVDVSLRLVEGERLLVPEADSVSVLDEVSVGWEVVDPEGVRDIVVVAVLFLLMEDDPLLLREGVSAGWDSVSVLEYVTLLDEVSVGWEVADTEGVRDIVEVSVTLLLIVDDPLLLREGVSAALVDSQIVKLGVAVPLELSEGLLLAVSEAVVVDVILLEQEEVTVELIDPEPETEALAVRVERLLIDGAPLDVSEAVIVEDSLADLLLLSTCETLLVVEAVHVGVELAVSLSLDEGVLLEEGLSLIVPVELRVVVGEGLLLEDPLSELDELSLTLPEDV